MGLFNTSIDYQGQDLHMLRNNVPFPLNKFFDTNVNQANFVYNLPLKLNTNTNNRTYEKIEITPNNEIIAGLYQGTSDIRIESFFIQISQNDETAVILVHLHDTLDKI